MPKGIHTVDFLIWIPDRSRFGDRNQRYECHWANTRMVFAMIHRLQDFEIKVLQLFMR